MVDRGLTTPSYQTWLAPLVVGLTVGSAFVPAAVAAEQLDLRPNVILISADDMRADDIVVMDNLQSLLTEQGTTFTNSFASFPLCGPSRASLVTGQYAHNHEVLANTPPLGGYKALDSSSTLATWLDDAGYQTTFLGKYVNGFGTVRPHTVPPGWDDFRASVNDGNYFSTKMFENGATTTYTDYQTDLYADIGADLITRDAGGDEPFFMWASFFAPHAGDPIESDDPSVVYGSRIPTPAVAPRHRDAFVDRPLTQDPSFNEADISDKPTDIRLLPTISEESQLVITELYQQRLESLLALDEAIGEMMAALAATGELDNTIILFTSDNGFTLGEHRHASGKIVPYEPAVRVPLVVRGPGFPAGQTRDQLVANVDLAPTFLDLADAQPGLVVDGLSLLPLAADPANRPARALVVEAGPSTADGPWFYRGIRTDRWLYLEYEGTAELEMYDMVADPFQLQSLHGNPAYDTRRAELAGRLAQLRNCAGPACLAGPGESIPPTVTTKTPVADATGVAAKSNLTATFSEPVDGVAATTFGLTDPSGADVPAAVTYNTTTRVATLNPTTNLGADTPYTATLTGGSSAIRDVTGIALATITWTFLTGPAPRVTNKTPAAGATAVSRTSNVAAKFQEPVTAVSGTTFTLTNAVTGATIPGVVSRNGTTNQWILNPSANLAPGTVYTVTLVGGPTAIRDLAGNALESTSWSFTTRS